MAKILLVRNCRKYSKSGFTDFCDCFHDKHILVINRKC